MITTFPAILVAGLLASAPLPEEPGPEVAFVHVSANVGAAAGGHAGLRVGDFVYHYLNADEGTLRLSRTEWTAFEHVYAGLQNRPLVLFELELAPADSRRIARRAARAWVDERRARDRVRRLEEDAAWWAALRDATPTPPLPGTGLFSRGRGASEGRELRDWLETQLGPDFGGRRLRQLDEGIAEWTRGAEPVQRLRRLCLEREVVRAVLRDAPVSRAECIAIDTGGALGEDELRALRGFQDALRASILRLWSSPRPDRGRALATAVARHHCVQRSLSEGRLLVLDAFPDDAARVRPGSDEAELAYAPLSARAEEVLASIRQAVLATDPPGEQLFGRLEESASRLREAERGARGRTVRVVSGRLLPSRGRPLSLSGIEVPGRVADEALRARRAAEEAARSHRERCRYSVLRRNCATELVRLLDDSFDGPEEVERALGERLVPGEAFAFVPWVLGEQVRSSLRLREVREIRSHLRRSTDALVRDGAGFWSRTAEGTTLLSSVYRPRSEDGWFLVFTDDSVWSRPLLGALNLGYASVGTLAGLLWAPFDEGETLRAGLHGAFYSLPELVFCNVRKGSFVFVPPTDPDPAPRPSSPGGSSR